MPTIKMDLDELIDEHTNLVNLLNKIIYALQKEKVKQSRELKAYIRKRDAMNN